MKNKYKAKKGAPFNDRDAQVIGNELTKIKEENNGLFTSRMVVENATNKNSKIHKFFEWDNTKAAEDFRLQQARSIIGHIVEVIVVREKPTDVRSFYSVSCENRGKVYVTLKTALEDDNYRQQLLNKMLMTSENLKEMIEIFVDDN